MRAAPLRDDSLPRAAVNGRYLVYDELRRTAWSSLHRGRRASDGLPVLIKLLPDSVPLDERARWLVQAEGWSRQSSPHLARILDFGCESSGRCFLVTEACEGRTLRAELDEKGTLPPGLVLSLLRQLCQALSGPHQAGLVHGGLDLENLVLCPGDAPGGERLVVLGFEASATPAASRSHCSAPEQSSVKASQSCTADVHAIGAIACQLLGGALPIPCRGGPQRRAGDLQRRALHLVPTLAETGSPGLGQLIADCLASDPARQPASASALARRLPASSGEDELCNVQAGSYRLLRLLGEGGLGTVWLAENPEIGARAAVKVVRRELARVAGLGGRFRREAEAVNRIESPHVVRIFDYGHLPDGREFVTMELLQGEALSDRLERSGRLAWPLVREIGIQLASALEAAHAARVVHRDVKPQNVYLAGSDEQPVVKLFDFGIAKLLDGDSASSSRRGWVKSSTSAGVFMGTPRYASPEQRLGAVVGTASDVYSLGLLLLELLEGRTSFDESNGGRREAAAAMLGRPEPHCRLIGEMLAESAEQRPSMAEVLRRLEALRDDEPAAASLRDAPDGAASRARRRFLRLGSLAAMLGVAALVAGLALQPARSSRARPALALHLLTVRSEPPGAEVYLEGVRLGTTPLRLQLERGLPALRLRLEKPGYRSGWLRTSPERTAVIVRLEPVRPSPAPVASHQPEPGDAHWQAGRAAFRSGSYERALRQFAEGYRVSGGEAFLFEMAECARLLRMRRAAHRLYRHYLALAPEPGQRKTALEHCRGLALGACTPSPPSAWAGRTARAGI